MQIKCIETFASECVIGGVEGNNIYYSGRHYRDKTDNMNFSERRNFVMSAIADGAAASTQVVAAAGQRQQVGAREGEVRSRAFVLPQRH